MQSEKLTPPTKHCYKKSLYPPLWQVARHYLDTLSTSKVSFSAGGASLLFKVSSGSRSLLSFFLSFNEEIIVLTSVYNNLQGLLEQLVTKCSHSALNKSLLSRHPQEILHFPSSFHFHQTQSHLLAH